MILTGFWASAQCLVQHIPLTERIADAQLVAEVEVIGQQSFIDKATDRILTANTVKIYQVFKGKQHFARTTTVYTLGGQVGDRMEMADPSLQFSPGDKGVLLLSNFTQMQDVFGDSYSGWFGVSGPTSFLRYNTVNQTAMDHHHEMGDISTQLYKALKVLCNEPDPLKSQDQMAFPVKSSFKKSVTSFSPSTISAGNQQVLTITGTGFGNTRGKVSFANGDDGGKTNIMVGRPYHFTKWTDTEIEVYVPKAAGTGEVSVITANNVSYTASNDLTVEYAFLEFSARNRAGDSVLVSPVLDDDDGEGGITWTFNDDFFQDKDAVEAFLRAAESWRCGTRVSFSVDTINSTSIDEVDRDDVHTVMWQNPNWQIGSGALGVCYSQWSGCLDVNNNEWHWYLNDVDLVFDDELSNNRTWNFSTRQPTSSQYDFQSVAVHELGHAHQLAHIIDNTGVMHYSIRNGEQKRKLKTSVDIAAGNEVMKKSNEPTGCGSVDPMQYIRPSECKLLNVTRPVADFTLSDNEVCGLDTIDVTDASEPTGNLTWSVSGKGYVVSTSGSSARISATEPGSYTVKLLVELDGYFDSTEKVVEFYTPAEIKGALIENITCNGADDGSIRMLLGGTQPIVVLWQHNSSSLNPLENLEPGNYTALITDANNCEARETYTITEPPALQATANGTDTWGDLWRGVVWVKANGGTPPYTYEWSDADKTANDTLSGLPAGQYLVTVTDSNGCTAQANHLVGTFPASIGQLSALGFTAYPNPVQNQLVLQNEGNAALSITVVNALGQIVDQMRVPANSTQTLLTTQWRKGLYQLRVQHHQQQHILPIVK